MCIRVRNALCFHPDPCPWWPQVRVCSVLVVRGLHSNAAVLDPVLLRVQGKWCGGSWGFVWVAVCGVWTAKPLQRSLRWRPPSHSTKSHPRWPSFCGVCTRHGGALSSSTSTSSRTCSFGLTVSWHAPSPPAALSSGRNPHAADPTRPPIRPQAQSPNPRRPRSLLPRRTDLGITGT